MLLAKILICHHLLKVQESDEELRQTIVIVLAAVYGWGGEGY